MASTGTHYVDEKNKCVNCILYTLHIQRNASVMSNLLSTKHALFMFWTFCFLSFSSNLIQKKQPQKLHIIKETKRSFYSCKVKRNVLSQYTNITLEKMPTTQQITRIARKKMSLFQFNQKLRAKVTHAIAYHSVETQ